MAEIHRTVREWTLKSLESKGTTPHDPTQTLAYLDLMFAWGLAVIGEQTVSQSLVETVRGVLDKPGGSDESALIGTFLFRGFKHRIDEAIAGKPHAGPLPAKLLDVLDNYRAKKQGVPNSPYATAEYCISRMRQMSAIFDPQEKLDATAETKKSFDDLSRTIAELPHYREPARLMRAFRDSYRDQAPCAAGRAGAIAA